MTYTDAEQKEIDYILALNNAGAIAPYDFMIRSPASNKVLAELVKAGEIIKVRHIDRVQGYVLTTHPLIGKLIDLLKYKLEKAGGKGARFEHMIAELEAARRDL